VDGTKAEAVVSAEAKAMVPTEDQLGSPGGNGTGGSEDNLIGRDYVTVRPSRDRWSLPGTSWRTSQRRTVLRPSAPALNSQAGRGGAGRVLLVNWLSPTRLLLSLVCHIAFKDTIVENILMYC
jgi:hypothetical protein